MTEKYEVRFVVEVRASSPEQAATIARDMLLDLDTQLSADVHEYEYCEAAEDWFPRENEGVLTYFGDVGAWNQTHGGVLRKYVGCGVRPVDSVAWGRGPFTLKGAAE